MRQGELYWLNFPGVGSEPRYRRPALVVQQDAFNRSAIATTVVAALTSNLRLAEMPGNVRLKKGEGGLEHASVVNASQIYTVDRGRLSEPIGTLSPTRMAEVLRGVSLVLGLS
ncbi:MAG: type II toxin-antitoxin system PemK/MazF family toxin [Candidatus Schekmanbacteria bacterium]|nr:type II toxin-antitoxin system PemK/MazF family toxin [Candidatus Schekmanbacteria bacterium]